MGWPVFFLKHNKNYSQRKRRLRGFASLVNWLLAMETELITQQSLARKVLTTLPNPTPLIYFFSYIWWEVKNNCPLIFFLNLIQNWSPYRRYHTLFATSLWHGYIRISEEESMDPLADKMPCQMSTEAALIPVSHFVHHSRTEAFYQRQKA